MRNCPNCQRKPITFYSWGQGFNAFRTRCQHCETHLSATATTYVFASASLACLVVGGLMALPFAEQFDAGEPRLLIAIPVAVGILLAAVSYWFCGYKEKSDEVNPFAEQFDTREERANRNLRKTKLGYIALALIFLGAMVYAGVFFRGVNEAKQKAALGELLGSEVPESFVVKTWELEDKRLTKMEFAAPLPEFEAYLLAIGVPPKEEGASSLVPRTVRKDGCSIRIELEEPGEEAVTTFSISYEAR